MNAASPSPHFSLRSRLAWGLGLAVSLFWLVAMAGAGLIVRHEINEVFDSALQEVVQRVLPLAYSDILAREADDTVEQRLADPGKHEEYITYIVRNAAGQVLLQSHDAEASRFPRDLPGGFASRNNERFYTETAVSGSIIVSAMERSGHRAGALGKAMLAMAWPLILLLPAIIAATFWLVSYTIRPVAKFGLAIARRGEGDLAPIDSGGLPAEVTPIGHAVNALLDRLRRALVTERSFTANAAHELRTPLAGALAQTQRLIAELGDSPARHRAGEIEAALRRLTRLTEKLLQLAKIEGGALRAAERQDLRPVLRIVLADFPDKQRLDFSLPESPVLSSIDIDVFAIALRNLVENALKYGTPATIVHIDLEENGLLRVANAGPVLTQEAFGQLCQRFQRGTSSEDGAGLGLAIVSAIAKGIGGNLTMVSPIAGTDNGVEMRLSFPLA